MDAYGNYFSDWYDKFLKEQTELMKRLSKSLSIDSTKVGGLSPDQVKQLTVNIEKIGKISEQNQVAIDQLKSYTQINLPPSFTDNIAKQARDSVNSDALAALNLNIQKLNRELMGISSAHPAIKRIVERAAELSTMQRQADTETAPEDNESPSAVEEFVENNPEEAERVANDVQSAVSRSINTTKDKWDSFPRSKQIELFLVTYIAFSESAFSTVGSPVTASAIAEVANKLVILLVTYCVIIQGEREENGEED
ncbi:hypothetical protein KZX32_05920 [Corynebacterium kefirresidentii]|uniref:hypothetical protein n=1 Tax=Corynebacterium kefirresidentii TaxID=1979527 RepID=UPI0020068B80|nr:hypothetical protein [Corynebacterium kefirresidentii]MCK6083028.1 hypothetical protein [Corynebacterium kefirresidentii]